MSEIAAKMIVSDEPTRKRSTKKDLEEFLKWSYERDLAKVSSLLISQQYYRETGKSISPSTIRKYRSRRVARTCE